MDTQMDPEVWMLSPVPHNIGLVLEVLFSLYTCCSRNGSHQWGCWPGALWSVTPEWWALHPSHQSELAATFQCPEGASQSLIDFQTMTPSHEWWKWLVALSLGGE